MAEKVDYAENGRFAVARQELAEEGAVDGVLGHALGEEEGGDRTPAVEDGMAIKRFEALGVFC